MAGKRGESVDVDLRLAGLGCRTHVKPVLVKVVKFLPKNCRAPVSIDVKEKKKTLPHTIATLQLGVVQLVAELAVVNDGDKACADWDGQIWSPFSDEHSFESTKRYQRRRHLLLLNQQMAGVIDSIYNLS